MDPRIRGTPKQDTTEDDNPPRKRVKQGSEDSSSEYEYVLISALIGIVTHGRKDWLIDNGASKHMTGLKESFKKLFEHNSPHKLKLGDGYQYCIKGSGESSYNLDSKKSIKMKDVLFVLALKENLLSISTLDAKGMRVAFVDGQVLMWPRGKTIDDAIVIGEQEGGLYKLKGYLEQAMVHDIVEPNELWHRRLTNVHYKALPLASKVVEGILEIQTKCDSVYKGCAKGKNTKKTFPSSKSKEKGILEIIHSNVCGPMSSSSLSSVYTMFLLLIIFLGRHGYNS